MSLSFGSQKKKGSSSSVSNPWEPTQDPLKDIVSRLGNYSNTNVGATDDQLDAFAQLKVNAADGNEYADEIGQLSADLFGADSRSGEVESAYADLTRRLAPTADGANLDVNENPYLQEMLQNTSDNIFNRINASFAGAGRNITGNTAGQKAVGKGISEGTLPTLFNQHNLERNNQVDAAKTLFQGGTGAAQTAQGLDDAAMGQRLQGVNVSQAALDAENYGPNTILNLEEQLKDLPAEDLALYTQLIGSIAGLGGQVEGTSKQSGSSFGLGANLLSDERSKEGPDGGEPEKIGELANGTPIYRYRYKSDPNKRVQIGVMAQDVEKDDPDAVTEYGGMKYVDVDRATDEAARRARKKKDGGGNAYA
jgi:hypothetical protein